MRIVGRWTDMTQRTVYSRAKSFTVRKIWDVGIANDIEWLVYKTIQFKLFAVLNLNSKVNKPLRLSQSTKLLNRQKIIIYDNSHIC